MSQNDSNPLKQITKRVDARAPVDRIEQIWEGARDVQDMMRDKKRREQRSSVDFTDTEEITKTDHQVIVHTHIHQSQPDTEDSPLKVPTKWQPLAALGAGLGAAVIAGLAAALQHCGH